MPAVKRNLRELPAFHSRVYRPKRSRYMVLIPVLNEDGRIQAQLARMRAGGAMQQADVVLVDGGSTDGSLKEAFLRRQGVRALLVKTGPGRQGAQIRVGLAWALDRGYQGVILMDGNNKDDPAGIEGFARALDAGWDHVQGSRFIRGGAHQNTPAARWLGVRLLHAPLLSLAARFPYSDTTTGFRAYSRRLLLDPLVQPFRNVFVGYEFHYYMAIRAARMGFKVREIPVTRNYPQDGEVPSKIHGLGGYLAVLRTLADACLGRFNPRGAP